MVGAQRGWISPPSTRRTPPDPLLSSVLVANRGEIARRIIRACRSLGIRSVAVYSEADRTWPFVAEADEAVAIGPAPPRESYLHIDRVLEAARHTRVEAIHPGYGFLSENWRFAQACEEAGFIFVGPPWQVIEQMGDKVAARRLMAAAGVPVVPGSEGTVDTVEAARDVADRVGYPIILKAAAGGGGIGMMQVAAESALEAAFTAAQRRAQSAFGSGALFVERFLRSPRHVEVQVFADGHGRLVHLHERECSIQRRHQKLIEESPAPNLSADLKARLTAAAVAGAKAVGYVNAGTVEFIVAGTDFYFLEMNTRLQVEHPVTEEVTGLDLVQAQFRVAAGEPLEWNQDEIRQHGSSIECRIYAEDSARRFLPSPGRLARLAMPAGPGIRVECGVAEGVEVSVHYDSLLAKLVASGSTRDEAISRLAAALDACVVEGVRTVIPFHQRVVQSPAFRAGAVHTQMVEEGAFDG
jgi:acetyl-CoA carboxylase biotin carboxylase subunit